MTQDEIDEALNAPESERSAHVAMLVARTFSCAEITRAEEMACVEVENKGSYPILVYVRDGGEKVDIEIDGVPAKKAFTLIAIIRAFLDHERIKSEQRDRR